MISKAIMHQINSKPVFNSIDSAQLCIDLIRKWIDVNEKEKALEWLKRGDAHLCEIMEYVMNM